MTAAILDTETTGKNQPLPIEVGYLLIPSPGEPLTSSYNERFNPGKPIELGAMAIHMILDSDLVDCRSHTEFAMPDVQYMIGHNVDYDWNVLGRPDVRRICTLVLARYVWPQLDSHTQTALLLSFNPELARDWLNNHQTHSALVDVRICERILNGIISELKPVLWGGENPTWEQLWQLCESLRIPKVMPFGKHKDKTFDKLPVDYINWYMGATDQDPYVLLAMVQSMARRGDPVAQRLLQKYNDPYAMMEAIPHEMR